MTIGSKIRDTRKKAGLTQAKLGKRLGVSYQTVAQWENDLRNPKFTTLQRIADALQVEVSVFLPKEFIDSLGIRPEEELFVGPDNNFYSRPRNADKAAKSGEENPWELKLLEAFEKLSLDGQIIAVERVEELTEIPKYQKEPPQD